MTEKLAPPNVGEFIQYCAALFQRPGVADACLALQDGKDWNVNCLLLAAWGAREGLRMEEGFWEDAKRAIAVLDGEVVKPIRTLRRGISRNPKIREELRSGLKRMLWYAELRAEQAVEAELHRVALARAERGAATIEGNIAAYAGQMNDEIRSLAALMSEDRR